MGKASEERVCMRGMQGVLSEACTLLRALSEACAFVPSFVSYGEGFMIRVCLSS